MNALHLKILTPAEVFLDRNDVERLVVETRAGSMGFLPRRLDCTVALAPGILGFHSASDGEVHVAVDAGVLVKAGGEVLVSVRKAIGGADLKGLLAAVEREFLNLDEHERSARSVLARLESGFVRRYLEYHHE